MSSQAISSVVENVVEAVVEDIPKLDIGFEARLAKFREFMGKAYKEGAVQKDPMWLLLNATKHVKVFGEDVVSYFRTHVISDYTEGEAALQKMDELYDEAKAAAPEVEKVVTDVEDTVQDAKKLKVGATISEAEETVSDAEKVEVTLQVPVNTPVPPAGVAPKFTFSASPQASSSAPVNTPVPPAGVAPKVTLSGSPQASSSAPGTAASSSPSGSGTTD
jgi:hypothetical protein